MTTRHPTPSVELDKTFTATLRKSSNTLDERMPR